MVGVINDMMDNSFTAGIDRKLKLTPDLVESLWPTAVNVIPELIIRICYDLGKLSKS